MLRFTKLHGAGNDFIVVDARDGSRDWSKLAAAICERHLGAGADGLLTLHGSDVADLRMGLYNADGSEAEMSGNGLRCFVKYAVDRGIATPNEGVVQVETLAGVLATTVELHSGNVISAQVGMGRPRFAPREIPVALEADPPLTDIPLEIDGQALSLTCISMGNPHAVQFIDAPVENYPLAAVGPKVERHEMFPQRVNFEVARVLSRDRIEARTWERGVGETLACGTGACAVMVGAHLQGLVDDRVELHEAGGTLVLAWDGEGEVSLAGPAAEVYSGEWPE